MHRNDSSYIALHLNHSIPKSKFRKNLVENTIIANEIDKLRQQILENKRKLKSVELILKIAKMFWNAFSNFSPYFLIVFYFRW